MGYNSRPVAHGLLIKAISSLALFKAFSHTLLLEAFRPLSVIKQLKQFATGTKSLHTVVETLSNKLHCTATGFLHELITHTHGILKDRDTR